MTTTLKTSIAIVGAIALVIGAAALSKRPATPASSGAYSGGTIVVEPLFRELGDISIRGGNVPVTYTIRNTSDQPLEIRRVTTSCMCTTATIRIGDTVSPKFGMPGHGGLPPAWTGTIPPNGTATLDAVFDPLAHGPSGTGPIDRVIYLTTSDPRNPEASVRFTGRVNP